MFDGSAVSSKGAMADRSTKTQLHIVNMLEGFALSQQWDSLWQQASGISKHTSGATSELMTMSAET